MCKLYYTIFITGAAVSGVGLRGGVCFRAVGKDLGFVITKRLRGGWVGAF